MTDDGYEEPISKKKAAKLMADIRKTSKYFGTLSKLSLTEKLKKYEY
jgi:hypothetical protein